MTQPPERAEAARRALACLDLTDLSETADEAGAERLCARAVTPYGPVAAVCLWPRFVARAKAALQGRAVRVATVANFPEGGEDTSAVLREVEAALADGADEVDLVMPYRAFLSGRGDIAETQILQVRRAIPHERALKVILETGRLGTPERVREAARLAIEAGADFVKTSTGKTEVGATLEAAGAMLGAIRESGARTGLKVSGGVRTVEDAASYLDLAARMMGEGWITPRTFRIGASGLIDALLSGLCVLQNA